MQQAKNMSTLFKIKQRRFEDTLRLVYYDRRIFILFPTDLFLNLSLAPLP